MDIFGLGGDTTKTRTTQTQSNPSWVNQAGMQNYAGMIRAVNKPYQPYTQQRVAGATPLELRAWGAAGKMLGAPTYFDEAADFIRQFGQAPAQQISMPKELAGEYAAKENPYEKDYFNPYLQQALDPAVRAIRENTDLNRQNLNAQAMSAGAFGDTGHALGQSQLYRDESQNIGDITGQTYAAAYGNAQQQRANAIAQLLGLQGQDVSNKMAAEGTNAALMEQMFGRQAQAGGALSGLQGAQTADELSRINAAAGAGQSQRAIQQAIMDFAYQQFLEGRDWDQNSINILMSALNGTPYARSTIQSTEKPDTSLQQILGSILGSVAQ